MNSHTETNVELTVLMPCARRFGSRDATAWNTPRSLKDPIGWWISSLSRMSGSSPCSGTRSVLRTTPSRPAAAARYSDSVGGARAGMAPSVLSGELS